MTVVSCMMKSRSTTRPSQGFSLIELMVSMLIGLIIVAGVIQIVVNSKRSFIDNQGMSQIQETARYAIEVLRREVRMAGYFGCVLAEDGNVNITQQVSNLNNSLSPGFILSPSNQSLQGIEGYELGVGAPTAFGGSITAGDAFVIRRTSTEDGFSVLKDAVLSGSTLNTSNVGKIKQGLPLILASADCQNAIMFNAGAVDSIGNTIQGLPTISDAPLESFVQGSNVSRLLVSGFYIGNSTVVDNMPALMREVFWVDSGTLKTRSEELALGVESMDISYGIGDIGGDLTFKDASGISGDEWGEVAMVRINLSLRSQASIGGNSLRHQVSSSILIRNRGQG